MRLSFKIAANTFVQVLGKIISAVITFVITLALARNYGVLGFGEFVKIITYVSLFYLVVDFGFNAVVLQEIKKHEKNESEYFGNLLGLRIVFSLCLIFLALSVLSFLPFNPLTDQGFTPFTKLGIILLSATILTQAVFVTNNIIFQKNLRYDQSVIAGSCASFLTLFLIALVVYAKLPLIFIILSYLVGGIALAFISLFLVNLMLKKIFLRFNFSWWRKIFIKSFPLGIALIFNLFYFKNDTLILTLFRTTEEVGIYGLARAFFEFHLTVPVFVMNAVYPVLVDQKREDVSKFVSTVKKVATLLLISSLILVFFNFIIAPYLSLVKPGFKASVLPFRILSLSLPFFFLSGCLVWVLIALGKQRSLIFVYGFSLFFNLFLNLVFISRFGYLAASVNLGLTEGLILVFLLKTSLEELKKLQSKN